MASTFINQNLTLITGPLHDQFFSTLFQLSIGSLCGPGNRWVSFRNFSIVVQQDTQFFQIIFFNQPIRSIMCYKNNNSRQTNMHFAVNLQNFKFSSKGRPVSLHGLEKINDLGISQISMYNRIVQKAVEATDLSLCVDLQLNRKDHSIET